MADSPRCGCKGGYDEVIAEMAAWSSATCSSDGGETRDRCEESFSATYVCNCSMKMGEVEEGSDDKLSDIQGNTALPRTVARVESRFRS